ncbi:phosphatase PAP2 family protein [Nocardia sp. NPDC050406]|uniref:phosphatase PAP2 family protein n=1 Tax=Nocardia sp. NPDC050406 TaxID=3364318 RepID=UPI00378CA9B6
MRRRSWGELRPVRRHVSRPDRWLMRRSAALRPTSADGLLRTLSVSANHNRLWMAAGLALYAAGGTVPRRAAVRGLVATGIASGLANGVAKPLFPRRRPPGEAVPLVRRLMNPPVSSSFPSGHSASAAAFTVGVGLEYPRAAAVVAPVAAAVAYSRVHVGVHWPTDVLAGVALGSAIAVLTRVWWPVRAEEAAGVGEDGQVEPTLEKALALSAVTGSRGSIARP